MIYMVKNHDLGFRIIIFLLSTRVSPQSSCFFVLIILLPVYSYLNSKKVHKHHINNNPQLPQKNYADFASSLWKVAVVFLYCRCNRLCPRWHWPVPTRALGMASECLEAQSVDRQGACPNHGNYVGVSKNRGTPKTHPKMIIFSRKTHGCWVPPFLETSMWVIYSIPFCEGRPKKTWTISTGFPVFKKESDRKYPVEVYDMISLVRMLDL